MQMVCVKFHRECDTRVKSGLAGWQGPWRLVAGCFHQPALVLLSPCSLLEQIRLGDEGEGDPLPRRAS